MVRILVLEDETSIRDFVVINLERAGFEVFVADNGEEAIKIYNEQNGKFDVALLDIMLPGISGIEVCRYMRDRSQTLGIIMLTAKSQEVDKINGFSEGADDYITKPFSPSELIARVTSLSRRVKMNISTKSHEEDNLTQGKFTLNLRKRCLEINGTPVELTQMEFQIMEYFFSHRETEITRNDILKNVWGESYIGQDKIIDVNIRRLRVKIEDTPSAPKHIVTVWGVGYKWEPEEK